MVCTFYDEVVGVFWSFLILLHFDFAAGVDLFCNVFFSEFKSEGVCEGETTCRSWSSLSKGHLYFCLGERNTYLGHQRDDVNKMKDILLALL